MGLSRTAIFSDFAGYFSDTLEMRPVLLYTDMQSVVGFLVIPKCMSLNDLDWLFLWDSFTRAKFCFRAGWLSDMHRATSENKLNCVKTNKDILSAVQIFLSGTFVSGSIRFVRIFGGPWGSLQKEDVKGQWGRALTLVLNTFSWVSKTIAYKKSIRIDQYYI